MILETIYLLFFLVSFLTVDEYAHSDCENCIGMPMTMITEDENKPSGWFLYDTRNYKTTE